MKKQNNNASKNLINTEEYYMYGQHTVLSAIKNKHRVIKKIYCLNKQFAKLQKKISNHNVQIVENDFIINKIGKNHNHQGIIALVNTIFKKNITDFTFNQHKDRIAILDQISDPQNIGAIIRSATAFGINKIILPDNNSPYETASMAKAACGSIELPTIIKVNNIKNTIQALKKMGFWIAGLDINGKNNTNDLAQIDKLAIIIGSENKGMRRLTKENCDFLIKIPISKHVESLNASNAATIIFYLTRNI